MSKPKVEAGYVQDRDERNLTKRHRQVLRLLYAGRNMSEAGRELGITRARVSAIVKELQTRGFVTREGRKVIVNVERLIG